ncbi:restriction endonuclease subunit S [Saccharibacillus qingshengii]|uniref:restriction endonuclease subunit S n=1 Tax=Saccharibacillus qingshengii TaxID=1763540 RepID=UPI0015516AA3|nr:restriction endonuclease subunit S [Saccharibacillus qingshengii]
MHSLYNYIPLKKIVKISTKSISPEKEPSRDFRHFSIPAFDKNRAPALQKGGTIQSNKYLLQAPSILLSKLNPRINRVWRYDHDMTSVASICSTEFIVYEPIKENISLDFYSYCFQSQGFQEELLNLQSGSTGSRMRVTPKDTLNIEVPLPTINEQQKIAEILSSVDEAIEKTEAIIKQTETVKKGLMKELLTKGIGHTEFKQTEVGQMPKAWEVKSLKETTEKIQDGTHFSPKTVEEGVLYVTSRNIRPFKFDWNTTEYISQEDHEKIYKRCNVKRGDVLLTKDGANTGNALVNTIDEEFSLLSSVCFIRCSEVLNNMFLCQYLNSEMFRKEMALKMTGNAIKRLTLTIINNLKIPFPSIEEQNHIAQILCSFDQRREVEEQRLNKLSNLKKSLMQSLLTGKVRVNVDQPEVLV